MTSISPADKQHELGLREQYGKTIIKLCIYIYTHTNVIRRLVCLGYSKNQFFH